MSNEPTNDELKARVAEAEKLIGEMSDMIHNIAVLEVSSDKRPWSLSEHEGASIICARAEAFLPPSNEPKPEPSEADLNEAMHTGDYSKVKK